MTDPASRPRVSIVCIFYDAERFLTEAVDSVLAQDFADWELILVDDGSHDRGGTIASAYAARWPERVRYVQHSDRANHGTGASRNLGLSLSHGEFVAFIDADDVWRPEKLSRQVALLEAKPEAGMLCGTVNYWSSWNGGKDRLIPTGHIRNAVSGPSETALALYPLGNAHAPCPSDVLIRRDAIEAVGGFEDEFRGLYEDMAFFLKIYLSFPVVFTSGVWLDYRQHPDSCVALALRQGTYKGIRARFLDWLTDYIEDRKFSEKEQVARAIANARRALERPWRTRIKRRLFGA